MKEPLTTPAEPTPAQQIETRLRIATLTLLQSQRLLLRSGELMLKITHARTSNGARVRRLVEEIELLAGPIPRRRR